MAGVTEAGQATVTVEAAQRGIRQRVSTQRALDVLFWIAVAGVVIANLFILVPAFTTVRLWEDEAFNLTVPLNLLRGLGYASDGTLSGSTLTLFDVRTSTGPVMLLPVAALMALGIEPVLAGRIVGLLGWVLLLGSLWFVGRRLGGKWIGLVAAAVPLAYAADPLPSPIQTPVDVLGEVTAAGLLVCALVVLHKRPWLAGLLVGLAIQTKFIALLAVPAFALAALLDAPGPRLMTRVRATLPRVLGAAAFAAAPTLVYEVTKFVALGPEAGVENVLHFAGFLLGGGQLGYSVSPIDKLTVLVNAWHLPWWVVLAIVVVGLVLAVIGARAVLRDPRLLGEAQGRPAGGSPAGEARAEVSQAEVSQAEVSRAEVSQAEVSQAEVSQAGAARAGRREFAVVAGAAALGLVTYLAWWLVSSHTPAWLRHPAPGVLAFLPVVIAATVVLARVALRATGSRKAGRVVGVGLALAGAAALAFSFTGRITAPAYGMWETLDDQRAAAADLADFDNERLASRWGPEVSVIVMSGAHAGLIDAGAAVAGDPHVWIFEPPEPCQLLVQTGEYRLCEAPEPLDG